MKTLSGLVVLAVLLSLASLAPLAAEEAPAPPLAFAAIEASLAALPPGCVRFYCPIYPDYGCSCEWVWCEQSQTYECGEPRYSAASTTALASSCDALMSPAS